MGDDLFQDLPPPSAPKSQQVKSSTAPKSQQAKSSTATVFEEFSQAPAPPPRPALKSALKRSKPASVETLKVEDTVPEKSEKQEKKKLRFKTTTDASEEQVIGAMVKIASHIRTPSKFPKASKLAIQLIQAGSVKPANSDHFFAILEGAMSSLTACNEGALRADYHALFSAAQDTLECLDKKQKNHLSTWTLRAVVANDLFTDDSFVFSKALGKIKEAISNLPIATVNEDNAEASDLKDVSAVEVNGDELSHSSSHPEEEEEEADPFGLDALMPSTSNKDDKLKAKRNAAIEKTRKEVEEEEYKRSLKSQREALISCLDFAAKRYKIPWCQTGIDILVKFAFDNISRFTAKQREAIEKLWASIREQQIRRKQGKSVSGKLDVNGFEWLQQKYSTEKISIRHSVGGSGDRCCQQWLG